MDILNLYYDHYKETNKLNKEAQKSVIDIICYYA